jgi:uncharacterized protein
MATSRFRFALLAAWLWWLEPATAEELQQSASPHLQQHAANPITWQLWSPTALPAPSGRLVFLSVGYSSCHWCHVMNRDVFNDGAVADALQDDFLAIKVDRDEYPELDVGLQQIALLSGQGGGWPLNVIMTSSGVPLHFMNYVSATELIDVLTSYSEQASQNPAGLTAQAAMMSSLMDVQQPGPMQAKLSTEGLRKRYKETVTKALSQWDWVYGGISGTPKAPRETILLGLLDSYRRQPDPAIEDAVRLQLSGMWKGGLVDAVNGGVFRYSGGADWSQPHFEKMLYTQALVLRVLAEAAFTFGEQGYREQALALLDFLDKSFRSGVAYGSALDSESGGIDGGWYTVAPQQLTSADRHWLEQHTSLSVMPTGRWYPVVAATGDSAARQRLTDILQKQNAELGAPKIDPRIMIGWNAMVVQGVNALLMDPELESGMRTQLLAHNQKLLTYLNSYAVTDDRGLARYLRDGQGFLSATERDLAAFAVAQFEFALVSADDQWTDRAMALYEPSVLQAQQQQIAMPALQNLNRGIDHEISSAQAELVMAKALGERSWIIPDSKHQLLSNQGIVESINTSSDLGRFALLRSLATQKRGTGLPVQYSKGGKARLTIRNDLTADRRTAAFEIELKQGWKVSAPDQPPGAVLKSLAATWVSADGNTLQAAVNSEAKNWVQGEFGQSFSGLQKLSITRPSLWQDKPLSLRLQLQVCSTSVCLLPENFWLAFPSAQE